MSRQETMQEEPASVHEWLFKIQGCSESLLADLARDDENGNGYWLRVENFINNNMNTDVRLISPREMAWLEKIRNGLLEEALK